ncbi:MAG: malto-oligosyltrehalose synthase [Rhodospirillales bacterium]|nr:malto-oligosyltrehalose synthase [Rhodospirillales bacterium]
MSVLKPTLSTTPRATARLQFHKGFTLDDAAKIVPYLSALGISHLYASPILKARAGSTHGYDIVDHHEINPELGGLPSLRRLVAVLRHHAMGLLLDIVPNHMGVGGADNHWWLDVLEFGPASMFANFFDINWHPADPNLTGKLLAPFLGAAYGDVLESGDLKLRLDKETGRLYFDYFEHYFPLSPRSAALVLRGVEGAADISRAFANAARMRHPAVESEKAKEALKNFAATHMPALEEIFVRFTAPRALHELLQRQHYRLAWWRTASDEINWRRFFDINTLAGLRVELPKVFNATHGFLLGLYAEGLIDGVRIDHIDGLADPRAYARKLRRAMAEAGMARPPEAAQGMPYIVVEKILAPWERLDRNWQTDGTTGYDFMDQVAAVLHNPEGEAPLSRLWENLTGRPAAFAAEEEPARRQILRDNLASELHSLAAQLHHAAQREFHTRDYTLSAIRRGLREILVHFPVYRLYAGQAGGSAVDAQMLERAIAGARRSYRPADVGIFDLLRKWLLTEPPRALPPNARRADRLRSMVSFQQLSAPTAAKSVEDTAFYRYGRLLSRNEVGSSPGQFALSPAGFHNLMAARRRSFPGALLATATHDHKRGEDTRLRLAVLSEIPDEWERMVTRWTRLNNLIREQAGPDMADELMLYQMLVAGWPLGLEAKDASSIDAYGNRVMEWLRKAMREAKRHSEWAAPNETYEAAAKRFLFHCLDAARPVLDEIVSFSRRIGPAGAMNGLAQTLIRLTAPGVPDLYQGTEYWDQSFVDPDNRRPVNFTARIASLSKPLPDIADWQDGRLKQGIIGRALNLRAQCPEIFAAGRYEKLTARGQAASHVLAFRRSHAQGEIVTAVTRLAGKFDPGQPKLAEHVWGRTSLTIGAGEWEDVLTGERRSLRGSIRLAALFSCLPVALLRRV